MENLKEMSIEQLQALKSEVENELASRQDKKYKIVELEYNQYKGTGKCWIAEVDPETKKILSFLNVESVRGDRNQGAKIFKVPLFEGKTYLFCQTGSRGSDSKVYQTVTNGELK